MKKIELEYIKSSSSDISIDNDDSKSTSIVTSPRSDVDVFLEDNVSKLKAIDTLKRKVKYSLVKGCKKRKLYQPKQRSKETFTQRKKDEYNGRSENIVINQEEHDLLKILQELKEELIQSVTRAVDEVVTNFKNKYKSKLKEEKYKADPNAEYIQNTPDVLCMLNEQFLYKLDQLFSDLSTLKPNNVSELDTSSQQLGMLTPKSFNYTNEFKSEININPVTECSTSLSRAENDVFNFKLDNNIGVTNICLDKAHLRKAKLMFFWTRYPSSAALKIYFPDIKFNKNNTAQLVKWFSNFREYFYKNVEMYSRRLAVENEQSSQNEAFKITRNSELFKTLNDHYNCNNFISPPEQFFHVIEWTVQEFCVAIQKDKDSEKNWKKVVYKMVARFDSLPPECFKDAEFLEKIK